MSAVSRTHAVSQGMVIGMLCTMSGTMGAGCACGRRVQQAGMQAVPQGPACLAIIHVLPACHCAGTWTVMLWSTNPRSAHPWPTPCLCRQGKGPLLYSEVASSGRNYHNMDWDVKWPDRDPHYDTMKTQGGFAGHLGKWVLPAGAIRMLASKA